MKIPEEDGKWKNWLADDFPPDLLLTPLSESTANEVVQHLKREADRQWYIDPHRSLEFADRIIAIGKQQDNLSHTALGMMARGEALKLLGRTAEAWETLDEAGRMFLTIEDEIGWARTRIGRLHLSTMLNRVPEALADAERAQIIFTSHGERERLLRLDNNIAFVYSLLGNQLEALRLYHSALGIAETLGETGERYLGQLFMHIGSAHKSLGDFSQALAYYERARRIYTTRGETLNLAAIDLNIAYIAQAQGYYRRALSLLYGILQRGVEKFPLEYGAVQRDMIECYLQLNRYVEARDLARQVIAYYRNLGATHDTACNLLHLATAEAKLNNYPAAQAALEEAEPIFTSLGAATWVATTHLRHGQLALKMGDIQAARYHSLIAAMCFRLNDQEVNYATASLLQGETQVAMGKFSEAASEALSALQVAQRYNVPLLRYASHLLLGQISEAQGETTRAIRRYQAAASTVERVQRGLTITLRTGFLEDKSEASRNLIALYLRTCQTKCAFEALERAKSQILLGYLSNREQFQWARGDVHNEALLTELNQLRAEHQWFYRLAHEPARDADRPNAIRPDHALAEVAVRERRIRSITEQLYLHSGDEYKNQSVTAISLSDVQNTLQEGTLLLEFYSDGSDLWAFIIDRRTIRVHSLNIPFGTLNQLLAQWRANIASVFTVDHRSDVARRLFRLARLILKRMHSLLIEPLALNQYNPQKLIIVPFGMLHYLPFHILYDGSGYLIEKQEIVILPIAGLVVRPPLKRGPGALILANSWEGRLPHTLAEAQMVQRLFGGTLCAGGAANRTALHRPPVQVLHIATHGEHRLDQPDLSYLQLADGQLYADDILQQDMSYELVTLSACETGRANVAASDELIGLGRGFLYTGAGALLVSLWQVADTSTLFFMERMYKTLKAGASKAAAVREAQRFMMAEEPWFHPAFWGAFQLIGDDKPLSSNQ